MLRKVAFSLLAALILSSLTLVSACSSADHEENRQESKNESKQGERKVLNFDKEVVKKIMMEEDNYSSREADDEIYALGEYSTQLQPILDAYIADRTISVAFDVEGLTIRMVMDKYGHDFWQGLLSMQGFIKDPERAHRTRNNLKPVRYHSLGEK